MERQCNFFDYTDTMERRRVDELGVKRHHGGNYRRGVFDWLLQRDNRILTRTIQKGGTYAKRDARHPPAHLLRLEITIS